MESIRLVYNIMYNIGKSRYVVNYHDGNKTYADGSAFFDIAIFHSRRKMDAFVNGLTWKGYSRESLAPLDASDPSREDGPREMTIPDDETSRVGHFTPEAGFIL